MLNGQLIPDEPLNDVPGDAGMVLSQNPTFGEGRVRLRQMLNDRADEPVRRLFDMLETHDKAVRDGLSGERNGVLSRSLEARICMYLNQFANGTSVQDMTLIQRADADSLPNPLTAMDTAERRKRIALLMADLESKGVSVANDDIIDAEVVEVNE